MTQLEKVVIHKRFIVIMKIVICMWLNFHIFAFHIKVFIFWFDFYIYAQSEPLNLIG